MAKMKEEQIKCELYGCDYVWTTGTGYAAHRRSHILRGEANLVDNNLVRVYEVPIAKTPYARRMRMDAIRRGEIKAQLSMPSSAQRKRVVPTGRTETHAIQIPTAQPTIDISKLDANQLAALRQQLGMANGEYVEGHSCSTTRAMDRMKQAIVLINVAEMLEDTPADQLLLMMSRLRDMPPLPRRG